MCATHPPLLLPLPLYAFTLWLWFIPNNVLQSIFPSGLGIYAPILCGLVADLFGGLGILALLPKLALPKRRRLPTLILAGLHLTVTAAVCILILAAVVRIFVNLFILGVGV